MRTMETVAQIVRWVIGEPDSFDGTPKYSRIGHETTAVRDMERSIQTHVRIRPGIQTRLRAPLIVRLFRLQTPPGHTDRQTMADHNPQLNLRGRQTDLVRIEEASV